MARLYPHLTNLRSAHTSLASASSPNSLNLASANPCCFNIESWQLLLSSTQGRLAFVSSSVIFLSLSFFSFWPRFTSLSLSIIPQLPLPLSSPSLFFLFFFSPLLSLSLFPLPLFSSFSLLSSPSPSFLSLSFLPLLPLPLSSPSLFFSTFSLLYSPTPSFLSLSFLISSSPSPSFTGKKVVD